MSFWIRGKKVHLSCKPSGKVIRMFAETLENSCPGGMPEAMTVEGEEESMMTQDSPERTSIPWHTSGQ